MDKIFIIFIALVIAITAQSVLASKDEKADSEDYRHLYGYQSVEMKKIQ